MPPDPAPVKGGVLRRFLVTAGDVITLFGRFLFRDFCFDPFSWPTEFVDRFCEGWSVLRGVLGGVVGPD
jgi:hypothetical protein